MEGLASVIDGGDQVLDWVEDELLDQLALRAQNKHLLVVERAVDRLVGRVPDVLWQADRHAHPDLVLSERAALGSFYWLRIQYFQCSLFLLWAD